MTRYERAIKVATEEAIQEHGGIAQAVREMTAFCQSLRAGSVSEYPIAMRRFYRCVLAQLRTDAANNGVRLEN